MKWRFLLYILTNTTSLSCFAPTIFPYAFHIHAMYNHLNVLPSLFLSHSLSILRETTNYYFWLMQRMSPNSVFLQTPHFIEPWTMMVHFCIEFWWFCYNVIFLLMFVVIFEKIPYATHFQTSQVGILHFRETTSEFQGESKQTRFFFCAILNRWLQKS